MKANLTFNLNDISSNDIERAVSAALRGDLSVTENVGGVVQIQIVPLSDTPLKGQEPLTAKAV